MHYSWLGATARPIDCRDKRTHISLVNDHMHRWREREWDREMERKIVCLKERYTQRKVQEERDRGMERWKCHRRYSCL